MQRVGVDLGKIVKIINRLAVRLYQSAKTEGTHNFESLQSFLDFGEAETDHATNADKGYSPSLPQAINPAL
jgi:hypothetical protein